MRPQSITKMHIWKLLQFYLESLRQFGLEEGTASYKASHWKTYMYYVLLMCSGDYR